MTEQEWREKFAYNLRRITRNRGHMFQKEWAELFDLSENTISRYRNCETTPDAYTIFRIANILGCSTDELINFE